MTIWRTSLVSASHITQCECPIKTDACIAPRAAERCIEMTGALIDLVHAENKIPSHVRKQKICFDEWNVWDSARANGRDGAEEK